MPRLDDDAVDLLLDNVEAEGAPVLRVAGEELGPVEVPEPWKDVLEGAEEPVTFIQRIWAPLSSLLPRTLALLPKKISAIALLQTETRPQSLLYLFGLDKELYANRGFLPSRKFTELARRYSLEPQLAAFYGVHDGWVDFFSLDAGLLPASDWRFGPPEEAAFLEIYRNGSDSLRYDLSTKPPSLVALQPDEEVVQSVQNLWPWLDAAYAETLDDLEDANG